MIRTRFAPSPTGFVHIGSLRTALFAFLFARHNNGQMILRIEDTDQSRQVEGAVENLLKVMKHIGIEFDEGFYLDENNVAQERGAFGPYLQSQRLELYQKYASDLIENKHAYYCFCSSERLDELRKEQTALKKPPMYDGHCRSLSPEEIQTKLAELKASGKNPVVRFAIPKEGHTVIHDLIYGEMTYENKLLDDQVILKSDGFPTYHLAVVVDDHHMEITHVIRGEEWIPSTPKHILIYQALGWQPSQFAHLPLILNPDKSKLSKRQGDVAVEDFLAKGYLKEALINFVAFLGWNPKTTQEIFSLEDLIKDFDLKNINKAAPIFDTTKLDWINSQYIRAKNSGELVNLALPYWEQQGISTESYQRGFLTAILEVEKSRLKTLSEIGERTKYFFELPKYESTLLTWKKSTPEDAKEKLLEIHGLLAQMDAEELKEQNKLEAKIKSTIAEKNYDTGSVLWPMRAALTGMPASPSPFEVTSALAHGPGKDEILRRIKLAADKI
ncbi:MAG: glutamate--tRNA ligase [Candidatus Doudnabacteria bacterium]|jgi:glutamyl-tRNA synthetase